MRGRAGREGCARFQFSKSVIPKHGRESLQNRTVAPLSAPFVVSSHHLCVFYVGRGWMASMGQSPRTRRRAEAASAARGSRGRAPATLSRRAISVCGSRDLASQLAQSTCGDVAPHRSACEVFWGHVAVPRACRAAGGPRETPELGGRAPYGMVSNRSTLACWRGSPARWVCPRCVMARRSCSPVSTWFGLGS